MFFVAMGPTHYKLLCVLCLGYAHIQWSQIRSEKRDSTAVFTKITINCFAVANIFAFNESIKHGSHWQNLPVSTEKSGSSLGLL